MTDKPHKNVERFAPDEFSHANYNEGVDDGIEWFAKDIANRLEGSVAALRAAGLRQAAAAMAVVPDLIRERAKEVS